MQLPNEVYCFTLRRGLFLLGTFTLLLHAVLLTNSVYTYKSWLTFKPEMTNKCVFQIAVFYCMIWSVLEIFANIALLRGILKKNWQMLLPWLILYGFLIIKVIVFNICFYLIMNMSLAKDDTFKWNLLVQAFILIALVYICYSFLCILTLYKKFRELSKPMLNQMTTELYIADYFYTTECIIIQEKPTEKA